MSRWLMQKQGPSLGVPSVLNLALGLTHCSTLTYYIIENVCIINVLH